HVLEFFLAGAFPHQEALLSRSNLVPRTGDKKPRGDDALGPRRLHHVAGKLLLDKLRVGAVLIERANDVIAVAPAVVAELVALEPLALAEAHHIEPVPAPTLAVMRTGQQTLHHFLISVRPGVIDEILDLARCRRQP